MERKNIKVTLLNMESLVLIDLLRKTPQNNIDRITPDDIKNVTIDEEVKNLSAQSCFVKISFEENMDEFFKMLCAIQASTPYCFKEIYSLPNKNKSLLFSYRLLSTVQKLNIVKPLNDIKIDSKEIIESTINTGLYKLLNDEFKLIKIDDDLNLLIGKAYRETWDILGGIRQVFTTFRLFGSYDKKDKFSGFVCLFNSELEEINKIMQLNIASFVEDFKHFLSNESQK